MSVTEAATLPSSTPISERWLLDRYRRTGDRGAREELVRRMMPLVRRVAGAYASQAQREDLHQVACLGLVKAIDRYDPAFGVPLRAYAVPTMSGEVRRYLRDHAWAVRVPRSLQERVLSLGESRTRFTSSHGREPTAQELADDLELSLEQVVEGLRAGTGYHAASLDAPTSSGSDGDRTLAETLGYDDDRLHTAEQVASLRELRDVLDDRDRLILHLRFVEECTQSQIAERIGLSQMHVSRLLRRALGRLAARVEAGVASGA